MNVDLIVSILSSSVLTAIATWGGKIYYESLKKKRKEKNHINTLRSIIAIYDDIQSLLRKTSIERIIVFKTHNGTGRPSVNKSFKVSALYGDSLLEDRKSDYQNLVVDKKYTEILLHIWDKQKPYTFITSKEGNSLLKRIYEGEGIENSHVYFVEMVKTGMIYASFSKYDNSPLTKKEQLEIEVVVRRWQFLFENEKEISEYRL